MPPSPLGVPMTTVQAPQSPSAQPSLVPVRPAWPRSHSSTVSVGSTSVSSCNSSLRRNRSGRMQVFECGLSLQIYNRRRPQFRRGRSDVSGLSVSGIDPDGNPMNAKTASESWLARLPKAELHLHIEGTLEPEMMFEL